MSTTPPLKAAQERQGFPTSASIEASSYNLFRLLKAVVGWHKTIELLGAADRRGICACFQALLHAPCWVLIRKNEAQWAAGESLVWQCSPGDESSFQCRKSIKSHLFPSP